MLDKLDRFIDNERGADFRDYSPDQVLLLLEHFGNPHRRLASIHVAGTNGKGSVSYMLQGIFISAGYATGLYTSPHLLQVNERISIRNRPIPEKDFDRYADEIIEYARSGSGPVPTYFDALTVIAFRYFLDKGVDMAIIETGLGGRLDSTNVIAPLCSVITDISLDHTAILGPTIESIASEKAGIIKNNTPVVTSNTGTNVLAVLEARAETMHAPLYVIDRDFKAERIAELNTGYRFDYQPVTLPYPAIGTIEIRHPLRRQISNSTLAITAALSVAGSFPSIDAGAIRRGLAHVTIPGRFELLSGDPMVLFDPAHNVSALTEMMGLVTGKYPSRDLTLVLALMKDKDVDGILSVIAGYGRIRILYYALDDDRCYRPQVRPGTGSFDAVIDSDMDELKSRLDRLTSPNSLFFFTGSFRLYRTARLYAAHAGGKAAQ